MGLDLQSLSITSAMYSIINFFQSAENQSAWRELSSTSEGGFLARLLANVMSNISYRIVAQSRENYLSTAALTSSNIGIAVNLGYSVFRGTNLRRLVNITPNVTETIPKLHVIGHYSEDYDIICLRDSDDSETDVYLEEGVARNVRTVVGKIKEVTFTAGTDAVKVFSLFTTGISEDYVLRLGSTEVPTTKVIKNMTEDKYLVRTNPYKSVDVMYLNTASGAQYVYGTDSEFTISYVELADVEVQPYTDDMFLYGTLNDSTNISTFQDFESVDNIKINAPLDHETQNLIRSKQDYANRLQQIVPAITGANYEALTPTYTLLSYLKNDFTLLTDSEKSEVMELLKNENYFGTPLPDIEAPRREVANLKIELKLNTKYKNASDVQEDIENILESSYDAKLGSTFSTFDLEREIENLSYVKYARVSHVINERDPDTNYQLGYILSQDDQYYIASKILGLSGESAPNWNLPVTPPGTIDTGYETTDGSLVWRAYKELPNMSTLVLSERQNNMQYGFGDYVYDSTNAPGYMFKCVSIKKSSGYTEPTIGTKVAKDFLVDGSIVWVIKERSDSYDDWASNTNYSLGDSVNVSTDTNYSLECISYTGTTDTGSLSFELPIYTVLSQTTSTFTVEGNKTFYFRPSDVISVTYSGSSDSFSVVSSTYDSTTDTTLITVPEGKISSDKTYLEIYATERGTIDGRILWTLIDDIDSIEYEWNGYVVFDYELTILE